MGGCVLFSGLDLEEVLGVARSAYGSAVGDVLRGYEDGIGYRLKGDGSPVTLADEAAEVRIRETVMLTYADHGFVGEETGVLRRGSLCCWVVDPIDGTKSYVSGFPDFGVLIGFAVDGEFVAGLAGFPALGRIFTAARGVGVWEGDERMGLLNERHKRERRDGGLIGFVSNPLRVREMLGDGWGTLREACAFFRFGGNCYGAMLVASGRVDFYIDAGLSVYDYGAVVPIIEGVGGVMSDWRGEELRLCADGRGSSGVVLAARSQTCHVELLSYLGGVGG